MSQDKCAPLPPARIAFADSKVEVIERQIARRKGAVQRHDASKLPPRVKLRDACRIECAMADWAGVEWLGWKGRGMPDIDGAEVRGSRFAMRGLTLYPQDLEQHPGLPMAWCRLVNAEGKKQAELNLVVCNGYYPLDEELLERERRFWWTEAYDVNGDRNPNADHWLVPFAAMGTVEELRDAIEQHAKGQ